MINRIVESEATKMLTTAKWYDRVGDPIAAEFIIRNLVERYPRSAATVHALEAIPAILSQLPEITLESAPDYEILRRAILDLDRSVIAGEQPGVTGLPSPAKDTGEPLVTSETTQPIPDNAAAEDMNTQLERDASPDDLLPGQPTPLNPGDDP